MKKIGILIALTFGFFSFYSCTSNEVKEISGTIIFNDIGSHVFNINADNIEATITIAGPNNGETLVYEHVPLYRTSDYYAKIGAESTGTLKTELLHNLVVMYEAASGTEQAQPSELADAGYIRIDWTGIN